VRVAHWAAQRTTLPKVYVEADGMRSQLDVLIAAAIEPQLFSKIAVRHGIKSLRYVLDHPVTFYDAPEIFCLDLYKDFDLDRISGLAGTVEQSDYLESPAK
jgi:hypothetical protein